MRICFIILNSFDYDSRARLICHDIISAGFDLDIIATEGSGTDNFEGAPIHRIHQRSKPFRQIRFIEFNVEAAAIASRLQAEILHAVDLDTLWAAVTAARHRRANVVYESRELYTELLALKNRSLTTWFWRNLEKRYIKRADAVITINLSIAGELVKRYGIAHPEIVHNVAAAQNTDKAINLRDEFQFDHKHILIYQGILRPGQGLTRILAALVQLKDTGLVIVGDGPERNTIEELIRRLGITDQVRFAGMINPDKLYEYTSGADAGVLLMENLALNNYLALPQKLFQYIMAGTPPIVSDMPELRRIVQNDNLGLVLPDKTAENDSAAIRKFLESDLEQAAANCRKARLKYSWDIEGGKIIEIYKGLG